MWNQPLLPFVIYFWIKELQYSSEIPKFQNYIKPTYTAINISKVFAMQITLLLSPAFDTAHIFKDFFFGYTVKHSSSITIFCHC